MTEKPTPRVARLLALLLAFLVAACGATSALPADQPPERPAARAPERQAAWKLAVVSDTQADLREGPRGTCHNDGVVRAIAGDIARERPDLVLVAGDLVSGWFKNDGVDFADQYAAWQAAMGAVYGAGIRVYPVRGNHDSGPERVALPPLPARHEPPPGALERLEQAYRKAFGHDYIPRNGPKGEAGLTYSFVHKNALIVGLDQYSGGQHKVNQTWLDAQLATAGDRHVFSFGHEAAFAAQHKDNLAFYPKERDAFWSSLGRAGARVYFCGHDHFYGWAVIPDSAGREIRQLIVGTGGGVQRSRPVAYADPRVRSEHHDTEHRGYLLVTVDGPRATIAWRAIAQEGDATSWKTLDSFAYDLGPGKGP
jgi:hypothetical protein